MTRESLGERIKNYRLKKGMSQFEVEIEVELAQGVLSRIENGKINPTKETLVKLIDILQLPHDDAALLFGIGDEPPTKEEADKVLEEVEIFLKDPTKLGYLTDNFWTFWGASETFKVILGQQGINVEEMRGGNVMEQLVQTSSPIRNLLSPENIETILLNQVSFFKHWLKERINTQWGKKTLARFMTYTDFKKYWELADPHKASFFNDEDRKVTFLIGGQKLDYLCTPRVVLSDSRFELIEFVPKG